MQGYEITQGSTAYPLEFLLVLSSDHITGLTGATPTVVISKNGGAFGSPAGAITEIAGGTGWYKVAPNATDSNTLGPIILRATATGADPSDWLYPCVAVNPQSAAYGLVLAKTTNLTGFNDIAATAIVSGGAINTVAGKVSEVTLVDTLTTYTGDTPQTGDAYARLGTAGAGLTALGDTRLANLDAAVSSRSTYAGGAVASVTGNVGGNVVGSAGSVTGLTPSLIAANVAAVMAMNPVGSVAGNVAGSVASVTGLTASSIATATLTDTSDQSTTGSLGKLTSLLIAALNGTSVFTTASLANAPTGSGGSSYTPAQIATSIWEDLLSGSDFAMTGSIGKLLATNTVNLSLAQAVPATNTAGTVGDALNAARAQGFGKWVQAGTTITLYGADGTTPVRVFTLDNATVPTVRS